MIPLLTSNLSEAKQVEPIERREDEKENISKIAIVNFETNQNLKIFY